MSDAPTAAKAPPWATPLEFARLDLAPGNILVVKLGSREPTPEDGAALKAMVPAGVELMLLGPDDQVIQINQSRRSDLASRVAVLEDQLGRTASAITQLMSPDQTRQFIADFNDAEPPPAKVEGHGGQPG